MAFAPCASSLRVSSRLFARTRPLNPATPRAVLSSRALTTTSPLLKKRKPVLPEEKPSSSSSNHASTKRVTGGKQKNIDVRAQESANSPLDPDAPDPLDFSPLLDALTPVDTHFKSQLQTLLHGGRFNPDTIGAVPVHVKPEDSQTDTADTFPLRELAQVVPRGRTHISLLLNDASYAKPIMSAIQSSPDFNQQPQKSEDNPLELILRVEAERKDEVVKRAKEVAQQWRDRVRQARSKHEKTMKDWKKKGLVLPDDLRKGERELQKLQDARMKDIDKEETQVVRQLQR